MARNPPASVEIRCEVEVKGIKGWRSPYDKDRQCARRSNQMRGLSSGKVIRVCFQHASAKAIQQWKGELNGG